jgi:predicted lactoylglutathione lyase
MTKQFWINLPVKDINRSKTFFTQLGFKLNLRQGNTENSACLLLGEKEVVVMLFEEAAFKGFTNSEIAETGKTAEVLLSIDAESKEEVDETVKKAIEAGGSSNHKPSAMTGATYGSVFTDPDGHRWNVLHMDMQKMPK